MILPWRVWPKSGLAGSVGELSQCTVMSEWLRLDSRFSSWLPTLRLRMPLCITCGSTHGLHRELSEGCMTDSEPMIRPARIATQQCIEAAADCGP